MFFKRDEIDLIVEELKEKVQTQRDLRDLYDLLKGVKRLYEKTTEEVMKPRIDVVMISEDDTLQDLVDKFLEHKYSRYPVLSSSGDRIVGIAHVKDVFSHINEDLRTIKVRDILKGNEKREPTFIPASQNCLRTLKELQSKKVAIGIVVDEYGNVIGIVTIEDLLEEIVGEIYEEHDREEEKYEKIDKGRYIFNASVPLAEVEEMLGIDFGDTESTSLGGFIIERMGSIPNVGESIRVGDYVLTVKEVSPQRILKVLVEKWGDGT